MDNTHLRNLEPSERAALAMMLERVQEFDGGDIALALELVDTYLDNPNQKDYIVQAASGPRGEIVGFLCYGPTPLTEGTYDLYWIAVDPDWAGQGVGSSMLAGMEETLRASGARLILIETSTAPQYRLTCQFYLKNGYRLVETIPDFYRDGEGRVTYAKRLV